jgi:hypothetical protein
METARKALLESVAQETDNRCRFRLELAQVARVISASFHQNPLFPHSNPYKNRAQAENFTFEVQRPEKLFCYVTEITK